MPITKFCPFRKFIFHLLIFKPPKYFGVTIVFTPLRASSPSSTTLFHLVYYFSVCSAPSCAARWPCSSYRSSFCTVQSLSKWSTNFLRVCTRSVLYLHTSSTILWCYFSSRPFSPDVSLSNHLYAKLTNISSRSSSHINERHIYLIPRAYIACWVKFTNILIRLYFERGLG